MPVRTDARDGRHDRAVLGVIATYVHELTAHGRPRAREEEHAHRPRLVALDPDEDGTTDTAAAAT